MAAARRLFSFAVVRQIITAKEIGVQYYERDAVKGYTTGGPGEILQGVDSESCFGLLESMVYYKEENPLVQLSSSQIDFERAEVLKQGKRIPLTAKEHDILQALYRNVGRIVTIDQLCEAA